MPATFKTGPFVGRPPGYRSLSSAITLGPLAPTPPAAVALDNYAAGTALNGTTTTQSFTVSGANPILYIAFHFNGDPGTISVVSYNGVGMTEVGSGYTIGAFSMWPHVYRLLNPAVGTHDLTITWTTPRVGSLGIISFNGVHPVTPQANIITEQDEGPPQTTSPSTVNGFVVDFLLHQDGTHPSPNGDNTSRVSAQGPFGGQYQEISTASGGATRAMNWNTGAWGVGNYHVTVELVASVIIPAFVITGEVGALLSRKALLGVG
jgi:hypothetical protein